MIVVVPCYNEASRLDERQVQQLLDDPRLRLLFVDDGSTDETATLVQSICERAPRGRADLLELPANRGKAEAVREGLLRALEDGEEVVGYVDADFATPPDEIVRLADELERTGARVALGSRVARLGASIDRKPARHYLGRIFATTAATVLGLMVYDTQCGAKLFRDTPALRHALDQPFSSRWSFDVELLGRLMAGGPGAPPVLPAQMIEVPLTTWVDVAGSKLGGKAALRAGLDLLSLGARVRRKGPRGFFPD